MHLHTPKRHSALPYLPYPPTYPRYPSRDQFIAYLEGYARRFGVEPRFNETAVGCTKSSAGWITQTPSGTWLSRHVIISTGFSRVANVPEWPGSTQFPGPIAHSSSYANGAPFRGKRVLVVGFGNSGAEIALDLLEHGARPAISVRGAVNVIPRDVLGIPVTYFALASRILPPALADRVNALTVRLTIGNLSEAGLRKRSDGPFVEILEHRQVPVIDVGTLAAVRRGSIDVYPALERFDGAQVRFADSRVEPFDAVILATGYRTALHELFPHDSGVLDDSGVPRRLDAADGLWFCGFRLAPTGFLREIAGDARRIARRIRTARAGT